MTVPAYAGAAQMPHRTHLSGVPTAPAGRDLSSAILDAATREDLSDGTFRFYALVVARFGSGAFSGPQAAQAAGVSLKTAWQYLGTLAAAELLTSRRAVIGENEHGRPIRQRIYRAQGVRA